MPASASSGWLPAGKPGGLFYLRTVVYNDRMDNLLHQLESFLLRKSRECALILGLGYTSYLAMKHGHRPIPRYVENHVRTLLALDAEHVNKVVRERLRGC
jgi:hypothetical protein